MATPRNPRPMGFHWTPWLISLARVYFTFLLGLTALRLAAGDRWWWLYALNTVTPYWFVPLPGMLLLALAVRQRGLWLGAGLCVALWAALYGGLFWPRAPVVTAAGPVFTVMTYNVLGSNTDSAAVLGALRAGQADVVALQELNSLNAAAIQRELSSLYPFQFLTPQDDVTGMGVISRYPLQPTGESLPGTWVGTPLVLTLTVAGRDVTLVAFHTYAGVRSVAPREQQARALADFARSHLAGSALVAAGDLNATDMNHAYALVTTALHDSWREAGQGFGHTFPGNSDMPGNLAPHLLGQWGPEWMFRIDYVFYGGRLAAVSAHTGPWDGSSDHRAMVVELEFEKLLKTR